MYPCCNKGPTNWFEKTAYIWRPLQPATCNSPMGRSVTHTICSGALTSSPHHRAPRTETVPTTDRRSRWIRSGGYDTGSPPDGAQRPQRHPASRQKTGQLVEATPTHVTQDPPSTCWQCGSKALATPWPLVQLLARHHHTPMAHATPERQQWLHTHFEPAQAAVLATVTWKPDTTAELHVNRGTFHTKHPALTYRVLAKHRTTIPEAPAYPVKQCCSRWVPETQTIEWTSCHQRGAYLLQYIHNYLSQGQEKQPRICTK